jgi:hypothetical protein
VAPFAGILKSEGDSGVGCAAFELVNPASGGDCGLGCTAFDVELIDPVDGGNSITKRYGIGM